MPEAHDPEIREVIYQGYRLVYRVRPDLVEVVMVTHVSRNLSDPDVQP